MLDEGKIEKLDSPGDGQAAVQLGNEGQTETADTPSDSADKVPVIKEAWDLAAAGAIPGGTLSNLDFVSDTVEWDESIPETTRLMLCDAQTSGGLVIAVPADKKDEMMKGLRGKAAVEAAHIGDFAEAGDGNTVVKT